MKDKQVASANGEPRIFFVSAVLHCVSMTVLVYLRSSFGFGYLRPRSVFFAFSWVFVLYAVYAWIDGTEWSHRRAVILFGGGAVFLYWTHLSIAFVREWKQSGKHERYSGISHLLLFKQKDEVTDFTHAEMNMHLWVEPGLTLLLSVILRLISGERMLSTWLFLVAVALFIKEALNLWFHLRQRKRQQDMFDDTGETMETPATSNLNTESPKATRKSKIFRPRVQTTHNDDER